MASAPAQVISIPQWREQMAGLPRVSMKEKIRMAEVLTSYEANNRYDFFDPAGGNIMYGEEKSSLMSRQCCGPVRRHWAFDVSQVVGGVRGSPFVHMDKPFGCTCLCLARPEVEVRDTQNQNVLLGSVTAPFSCCDYPLIAKAPDERELFKVKLDGNCCTQPGLWCPCPCGPCQRVHFKAEDLSGNELAKWEKTVPGWLAFLFAEGTDNYDIEFGPNQSPDEKGMMLATAVSLDMIYFNQPKNQNTPQ